MSVKPQFSARTLLTLFVIVSTLYLPWPTQSPAAVGHSEQAQTVNLTPQISQGDGQQVKVLFELDGTLKLKSETKDPVTRPVQVKAQLVYDEKVLEGSTNSTPWARSTARYYETAKANIRFRDGALAPKLRDDRRIVATSAQSADDIVLFSPMGPLRRGELDLIDVPANSAIIDSLLPNRTVKVGQSWQLESDLLHAILGIDAVSQHMITCKLDRIEGNLAVVHAQGSVSGASGGVSSEITLAAKFSFDMTRQRVSWFAMSLKEIRSMGHAQPGIEATVRIQMASIKRINLPTLHTDILADLNLDADDSARLLEFASPEGGFELLLSRNWHEMVDRKDVAVLRLVDRGDLIAQCNISALLPIEDGVPFTLMDFQQDVKNVLDDKFGDFVNATVSNSEQGLHVMRVFAAGTISDLEINWVYYHITNEEGQRASCVFTFESELADRFEAADATLISSFQFRQPQ